MAPGGRRGSALVIALGLALVLAIEIYIVTGYSASNMRMVGRMSCHRHGVYLGDSAFGQILARMRRTSWESRWFRDGPVLTTGQPMLGGRVDFWVADAEGERRTADVWIRATLEATVVSMFWRVRWREEALDIRNLVYPDFFAFLPPALPAPAGAAADPTLDASRALIAEQRANSATARDLARQAASVPDFAGMAAVLGLAPAGSVRDARPGGAPGSQAEYLRQALAEAGAPLPPPPSAPARSSLATRFPTPLDLPGVITAVFSDLGLPPASAPTTAHFADPRIAEAAFASASALQPTGVRDPRWETRIEYCKNYIVEVAKRSSGGCTSCQAALDALMSYLAEVTALEAERAVRAPPAAVTVNAYPYDDSGYSNALTKYREWWSQ